LPRLLGTLTQVLVGLGLLAVSPAAGGESPWHYQLYVDAGYAASDNEPANGIWRSKSTTFELDSPELFLGLANVRKEATPDSRWGVELGLQTGVDTEGLVPEPPPPAQEPMRDADQLRHLYRANASYRFGGERGVRLSGGVINSYIAFESYLAIDNPNHTKAYVTDIVPYFLVGLEADWDVSEQVDLGFYLVTGYSYLANPNNVPSAGFQADWSVSPHLSVKQNLYYGPDQAQTAIEFWRFLSDTVVDWSSGPIEIAAAFDFGSEKQAWLPSQPRYSWAAAALWIRWHFGKRFAVGVRPEFLRDDDGLVTGARQTLKAYTGTLKYEFSPRRHRLVGSLELRYDRSTGDEGGFYSGLDDRLVPDQTLVLFGLLWSLDG
jgi:hypothetical protein